MDTLLIDLFRAYYDARRNKRNTPSQLRFEMDLETNLINLYHELRDRRYKPAPSVCFIVQESVKREVFASNFRDRVVHHLYYNYVAPLFERQFVYDSYSCRKGKGTLLGIERLQHHIRAVSHNYTRDAYVLKMDIKGYFMSINREVLRMMVHEMTERVHLPEDQKGMVDYLTDIITMKNPLNGARFKGDPEEWHDLPPSKCLSCSPSGVGLPIGDLTSQLYSNIFLNQLDWFVTMNLGFKHYGRYVDDFYIVDTDRDRLEAAVSEISGLLASLHLSLHPKKTKIIPVTESIRFLGAVVYPYYRHGSSRTTQKFLQCCRAFDQVNELAEEGVLPCDWLDVENCQASMNSYLGYLRHFKAARLSSAFFVT
ncbi:MAG: RNA-directed DNA polymerase [Bacteroidales bacterium]|nr:RNA-directed DNA polymerase [Bacteroidales bacterium]